jgi:hypothetical protein
VRGVVRSRCKHGACVPCDPHVKQSGAPPATPVTNNQRFPQARTIFGIDWWACCFSFVRVLGCSCLGFWFDFL